MIERLCEPQLPDSLRRGLESDRLGRRIEGADEREKDVEGRIVPTVVDGNPGHAIERRLHDPAHTSTSTGASTLLRREEIIGRTNSIASTTSLARRQEGR